MGRLFCRLMIIIIVLLVLCLVNGVIPTIKSISNQPILAAYSINDNLNLLLRTLYLILIYLPALILTPWAYLSSWFRRKFWYGILVSTIAKSGPAFIKYGQWASSRPDIFTEDLCTHLTKLQSDAPQHRYKLQLGIFYTSIVGLIQLHFLKV